MIVDHNYHPIPDPPRLEFFVVESELFGAKFEVIDSFGATICEAADKPNAQYVADALNYYGEYCR